MSSSQEIQKYRGTAEIHHGNELCKKRSIELLEELSLPKGLLPLDDIIELGYDRSSGFFWLLQKKKHEHVFRKIGRKAMYDTEVTAFVESRRMRKMTGVKTKELMMWVSLSEMYIDENSPEKMTVKGPAGLRLTFPVAAFELEEGGSK